jgi:hypothetical protein
MLPYFTVLYCNQLIMIHTWKLCYQFEPPDIVLNTFILVVK